MENENRENPTTDNAESSETKIVQDKEVTEEKITAESDLAEKRCPNCQALLTDEQLFCPECGTSFKKLCPNCKTELQDGQAFCPSCGQKIEQNAIAELNANISEFNANVEKRKNKKKIIPVLIGAAAFCVIAIYLVFTILLNPQHYIEKGDYQTAYKVASEKQKESILRENIIAVVSADCIDSLKDSSSFELRDAWIRFYKSYKIIIMKVAANNSYGNQIINYWYYSYDKDEKKYRLYTTFSDFNEEKTYSWDDSDERYEKKIKNLAKSIAENVMSDGIKINDDSIDTINKLFKENKLENVTLLDAEPQEQSK